ncbi:MAG: helix-turn-helix domain-containing protein [Candidatus Korobacteraceae bacterium]|jgi:hypothetical protein
MKSFEIIKAVRDYGPRDRVQRLVLLVLATYVNDAGLCWPKVKTIAENCCLSKRATLYRLAELERDGRIIVNRKAADDHKGNTYQIVLEKLATLRSKKESAAVYVLPRAGKEKAYEVTREQIDHWGGLFPGVDVEAELRHMIAWLESNPRRRKVKAERFITNWLGRAQDKRRNGTGTSTSVPVLPLGKGDALQNVPAENRQWRAELAAERAASATEKTRDT